MAIYGIEDLIKAENDGRLKITDREEFSAFSVNVRLGRLYQRRTVKAATINEHKMSQEEFIRELCEEVPLDDGIVVCPSDFYLWQPIEKIYLAEGLAGEITSRSSWARMGVKVQSRADDYLKWHYKAVSVYPLCTLKTTGTTVKIKRGDAMGQLFVNDVPEFCSDYWMKELIDSSELIVQRDGKQLA